MFHVKHETDFDVVVIGGGHAGVDAAHVAARMGVRTALVTLKKSDLGVMSCNPAIGGLGKGHLVREIDALDGLMGRVADASGIQFRLLNRKKGPAVQGPRTQADRKLYCNSMQAEISATPNLSVIEGEVVDLTMTGQSVEGVMLADGTTISSGKVILTSGTFLRGKILIGDVSYPAGRMGDDPSIRLADRVRDFGLQIGRLKTGTPPRLDGRTINWDILEQQPADKDPVMFSFLSTGPQARQISCGITHTNTQTHDIIRENLEKSAMYGGHIESVGPRYCPSIEDKVVRFSDKASHQVFLEPEGLDVSTVYPNGISTSLPEDIQLAYVHSMAGLEKVSVIQPGYAIEYDFVDPRSLKSSLELCDINNLYLAGQINGTTGYEEAAAQGVVAGINAARAVRGLESYTFRRQDCYIGVMIDDLITQGVTEPYRMFTSRAEYRLSLRADNADQRLTSIGSDLGCVGADRASKFQAKLDKLDKAKAALGSLSFSSRELAGVGARVNVDGPRRTGLESLSLPDVTVKSLTVLSPNLASVSHETSLQVERDALYSNYLVRQEIEAKTLGKDENRLIPSGFEYDALQGLSSELKDKLRRVRPETIAQAARIQGMTPAALTLVLTHLRRQELKRSA